MTELSRRAFLARTGAGAAAAGLIAVIPSLAVPASAAEKSDAHGDAAPAATDAKHVEGPLVVHVPDPRSGEVHFLFGTREVVHHDHALVARMLREAR